MYSPLPWIITCQHLFGKIQFQIACKQMIAETAIPHTQPSAKKIYPESLLRLLFCPINLFASLIKHWSEISGALSGKMKIASSNSSLLDGRTRITFFVIPLIILLFSPTVFENYTQIPGKSNHIMKYSRNYLAFLIIGLYNNSIINNFIQKGCLCYG